MTHAYLIGTEATRVLCGLPVRAGMRLAAIMLGGTGIRLLDQGLNGHVTCGRCLTTLADE